jgi:hypothetical protein
MVSANGTTQDFVISDYSGLTRRFRVGDMGPSGAGIVFYVFDDGTHGFEAAFPDWNGETELQSSIWSNCLDSAGDTGDGIAFGRTNTDAIISRTGHLESAAQLCRNFCGGMKHDWFLPSLEELKELRLSGILTGRKTDAYWSSTSSRTDPLLAAYLVIGAGSTGYTADFAFKRTEFFVRPVRIF